MLYSDTGDIYFAFERFVQHKKSIRACLPTGKDIERQASLPIQGYPPGRRDSEARAAYNTALRFKNQDKCTGKLGEDITERIHNYIDVARDYNLD